MTALKDRLMKYIKIMPSGCWEWQGNRHYKGYGRIQLDGKPQFAHRVSFRILKGDYQPIDLILHKCDNKPCVNPDHLYKGTKQDNARDMIERGQYHRWVGENAPLAKLNDAQVIRLRIDHASRKFSVAQLEKMYGIKKSQIHNIVTDKQRKDCL